MIIDALENSGLYEPLHPLFKKAFDFLKKENLAALPVGKIQLQGDDLFVNVVDIEGKTEAETYLETHEQYIDIQLPVGNSETMGWTPALKLKDTVAPYNAEKDILFYRDKASNLLLVQPYNFVIFFPEDGHQPGISTGVYRKIIIKVRV